MSVGRLKEAQGHSRALAMLCISGALVLAILLFEPAAAVAKRFDAYVACSAWRQKADPDRTCYGGDAPGAVFRAFRGDFVNYRVPSDRDERAPIATASVKRCGYFRMPGLLTKVRVRVVRGPVGSPGPASHEETLQPGTRSNPENWNCVGPQTGYARCSKSRPTRVIVARF